MAHSQPPVLTSFGTKEPQIYISSTNGEERLKSIGNETGENVHEANFKIFKTLSPITTSLTQYWVKKDLNLYIMYQQ